MATSTIRNPNEVLNGIVNEQYSVGISSIPANGVKDFSVNVAKSGYIPLVGIMGTTQAAAVVWVGLKGITNNVLSGTVRNITGSVVSINATLSVLYVPES